MSRRYWAMRTDKASEPLKYLSVELRNGRLRQGWGNSDERDLRQIRETDRADRTQDQKDTWRRARRLLADEKDGIKEGDVVLLPNMPEIGQWSMAEVVDNDYEYDMDNDFHDYGHTRRVRLLNTEGPINPLNELVAATLRQSMRCQGVLWSLDRYANAVEALVSGISSGEQLEEARDENKAIGSVKSAVLAALGDELDRRFQSAEFEKPCQMLLKEIYDNVEHTGGPKERGADFVCDFVDGLGVSHRVIVQVKKWEGDSDLAHPIDQIRVAYESYANVGAVAIFTTLDRITEVGEDAVKDVEEDLGIPVQVLTKAEVLDLFLRYLPDLQHESLEG